MSLCLSGTPGVAVRFARGTLNTDQWREAGWMTRALGRI